MTPPEREFGTPTRKGASRWSAHGDTRGGRPCCGGEWDPGRTVRATVVAGLLLGADDDRSGTVAALRLAWARVTGRLDLSRAEVRHTFSLAGCRLDEAVGLYGATTGTIEITDSRVPGIDAELAQIGGDLDLRRWTLESGPLTLVNARVTGNLPLADTRF